jgi:hypothetical protein
MASTRQLVYGVAALGALAWAGILVAEWTDRGDLQAELMGPRLALVIALLVGAIVLAVLALRPSRRSAA